MMLKISKFFLYLVPLAAVIVYQETLFPFIVGKYVFFRTVIDLALIFYAWHWASNENQKSKIKNQNENVKKNFWRQPLVIAVALFALIFVLAGFFGVNPQASFWSNFERGEGGLQIIHLFIFFALLGLTFKDEESWRKMLVVSVWSGVLVILYGVLGALNFGNFIGSNLCLRFSGSLGNPAYTGTFLIFSIFYAVYLAAGSIRKIKKWVWLGSAMVFFIFLLLTQTRGALLGLGVAIIFGFLYLFFSSPQIKAKIFSLSAAILLIVLGVLGYNFRQSIDIMPFCSDEFGGGSRILDVNFQTETFQTRLLLWQESIEAFKERPLLGWGPENFMVAFEKYYQPQFTVWYDRAHNIFFDYLVMTGILGLASFLGIFGVYYWMFFKFNQQPTPSSRAELTTGQATNNQQQEKSGDKNQLSAVSYKLLVSRALLFALPIAYLVQGIVLFDVLSIYINMFLFLAFANYKLNLKF